MFFFYLTSGTYNFVMDMRCPWHLEEQGAATPGGQTVLFHVRVLQEKPRV